MAGFRAAALSVPPNAKHIKTLTERGRGSGSDQFSRGRLRKAKQAYWLMKRCACFYYIEGEFSFESEGRKAFCAK